MHARPIQNPGAKLGNNNSQRPNNAMHIYDLASKLSVRVKQTAYMFTNTATITNNVVASCSHVTCLFERMQVRAYIRLCLHGQSTAAAHLVHTSINPWSEDKDGCLTHTACMYRKTSSARLGAYIYYT